MDALEKRVTERMALEARQHRAEQMKLGKQRTALVKDADKLLGVASGLFDTLKAGDLPTKAAGEKGTAALRSLAKISKTMVRVNTQMGEHADALTRLDDPAERQRRVEAAHKLGAADDSQPVSGLDAAEMVLVRRGKATHITDLTSEVLETGVVRLTGKTPAQTLSASLSKDAGKPDSRFVRVAPNVFDLRTREAEAVKS